MVVKMNGVAFSFDVAKCLMNANGGNAIYECMQITKNDTAKALMNETIIASMT